MFLSSLLVDNFDHGYSCDDKLQFLTSVLDSFPVACFMIDSSHRVIHWNHACEVLTGVAAENIVGTKDQGKVFYSNDRAVMADLVLEGAERAQVDALYHGKFRPSPTIPGTFEAEDFFPHFGDEGRWLYFTATRVCDARGKLVGAIETLQDVTRRRKVEAELQDSNERFKSLSRVDDLTQLFNYRHFHAVLNEEVGRAKRYEHPLSLMVFDLDFFKQVNDMHGHQEGDRVLRLVADQLNRWKRVSDFAFRFGGDEFSVILPETDIEAAKAAADRLMNHWGQLAAQNDNSCMTHGCSLSVGVAQLLADDSADSFLLRADNAAYEAKRSGRNRIVVKSAD